MHYLLDRVSYHAVYDSSVIEALIYAKASGFSGVQLALDVPCLSFENLSQADTEGICQFCDRESLRVVLHVPDDLSLVETSRHRLRGTFDYCAAMFEWCERVGCRLVNFHIGKPATFKMDGASTDISPPGLLAAAHRAFAENLRRLVELGAGRVTLCLETWAMTQATMQALQPHLDRDEIGLTWDLPKTLDEDGRILPEFERFLRLNAARIRQLHLHDRRDGRSHCVIGSGKVDFRALLQQIDPRNIQDCCIEVRPREMAAQSLRNLHRMLTARP